MTENPIKRAAKHVSYRAAPAGVGAGGGTGQRGGGSDALHAGVPARASSPPRPRAARLLFPPHSASARARSSPPPGPP